MEVIPGQYQNMRDIDVYNNLNEVDISATQLIPQQYYPNPTEEDYQIGYFRRYFAKRVNGKLYGYRAVASADIYAALVLSEVLSA